MKSKPSRSTERRKQSNERLDFKVPMKVEKSTEKVVAPPRVSKRSKSKGTKSSREINTSLGFHDMIDSIDHDVSDLKNRTINDID